MNQDGDINLDQMSLPRGAIVTLPISKGVLRLLQNVKTSKAYHQGAFSYGNDDELQIVSKFFHAAFYDRTRWYGGILLALIGSMVIDFCLTLPIVPPVISCSALPYNLNLQSYGLLVDALGATFIALGLFRGPQEILHDTPMRGVEAVELEVHPLL